MAKKHMGRNYLHNHPLMEKELNVPKDHVIVDRKDWEEVIKFFTQENLNTIYERIHNIANSID